MDAEPCGVCDYGVPSACTCRKPVIESDFCDCCGGSVLQCTCEWETRYCVDRIEGGEAIGPGYEVERCIKHEGWQ